jgi:hypothetical protein
LAAFLKRGFSQGRSRWLLRLAIPLVLGAAVLIWFLRGQSNHLTIENRSGQPIALLRIEVGGEKRTFRDVATGTDVTVPLSLKSDERFVIEGRLADETTIKASGATVERLRLIVLPRGEIKIQQGDKRT